MSKTNWKNINRKRINFEDDLVIIYDEENDEEVYRGIEDYDPWKDEEWKYEYKTNSYTYRTLRKICLDF